MPLATVPHAGPRWSTWVVLIGAVLGAHLVLLAGGPPSWAAHAPTASPADLFTPSAGPTPRTAPEAAPPRAVAVLTSQVRWIAPPVAQPAPPNPTQPLPTATAASKPAPPAAPAPQPPTAAPRTGSEPRWASLAATPPTEQEVETAPPAINAPPTALAEPVNAAVEATADAAANLNKTASETANETTNETPPTAEHSIALAQAPALPEGVHASAATASTTAPATRASSAGTQLGSAQPPASAQLSYTVEGQSKGLNYSATGSLDWRNEGRTYSARLEIRVFLLGNRVQTSQGQLASTGLQPQRFGDKSRSERAAHFDRSQNRIRFSNNAPDAELLPGAQDRLSVFLQLAGLLNARPDAFSPGHSIDIPVAGTSDSQTWRFQVQGLTPLELPAGNLIARHLVRETREPRDTQVDIWLAPSLGHLPVRIRLTQDNGDVVDQRLSALP